MTTDGEALDTSGDPRIVSLRRDEHGDWIARLECGHERHVRHDPPWVNRPWVVRADGRAAAIGRRIRCGTCATRESVGASG